MGGEREREEFLFRENFDAAAAAAAAAVVVVVVGMREGRGGKIVWASTIEGGRKTGMKDEEGDLSPARVTSNTS